MPLKDPSFTIGIEEEYLLVDQASRDLVREMPQDLFDAAQQALQGQVAREFLKSQIEVGTGVHESPREAGRELADLRATVAKLAGELGLAPIAASTHPFARGSTQEPTERDRYQAIARDLAGVGRRLVICGMHVHVGIEDDELRIDLMNQSRYFLPHLLMLSTSSPFCGRRGHRPQVVPPRRLPGAAAHGAARAFRELGGVPPHTVDLLVRNGIIEDASKIWWDMRPSARFPTLEMRVTDVCTRVEDAVCVAAMNVSILRMLYRIRRANQTLAHLSAVPARPRTAGARCATGYDGTLFDFGKGELVAFRDLVDELLGLLREDAEALGCLPEIEHARAIVGAAPAPTGRWHASSGW